VVLQTYAVILSLWASPLSLRKKETPPLRKAAIATQPLLPALVFVLAALARSTHVSKNLVEGYSFCYAWRNPNNLDRKSNSVSTPTRAKNSRASTKATISILSHVLFPVM
jgi:hypothetical protein